MRCLLVVSSALLAASTATSSAARRTSKPTLVLESHAGARPARLAPLLAKVDDGLETRGHAAFPKSIISLAGPNVPRPGILDSDLTSAQIAEKHNTAFALFGEAKWSQARDLLLEVRDHVRRNPALVADDITIHDLMFRTMVALAVCHQRLGDPSAATRAMTDAIRVYPARPVSRADAWAKEGETLYLDVTKSLQQVSRGRLRIAAGHRGAQISVEGQPRGVGNVSLADLVPGVYRVFIRTSSQDPGRQYEITVRPGEESFLKVDANVDRVLWASDEWVGLLFPNEAARTNECKLASELATRWTDSGAAVVLASGEENGRPILVGKRCVDGDEVRRAQIFTDAPNDPDKLVQFLDDITAEDRPDATVVKPERSSRLPIAVLASGAAVIVGSTALYLASPDDDFTQPDHDDNKSLAIDIYSGGAGVAGLGVYLWLTKSRSLPRASAAMYAAGTTALLLAAMYIPTDEDPHIEGWQRPTYRDTATAGVILAGVGAALMTSGYLLSQRQAADSAPRVSITGDGVSVGWMGSF